MKLSEIKKQLSIIENVTFLLPNGSYVSEHFHVTEVGLSTKKFIDCGGKVRNETVVNFQLWNANDLEHRLKPQRLLDIITLSEKVLGIKDYDIEVEFQAETIGKYDLGFNGKDFMLLNKNTACLAEDACGIPQEKQKVKLVEISSQANNCAPGGECC